MWRAGDIDGICRTGYATSPADRGTFDSRAADAEFIALARTALPHWIREAQALQGEVERLKAELRGLHSKMSSAVITCHHNNRIILCEMCNTTELRRLRAEVERLRADNAAFDSCNRARRAAEGEAERLRGEVRELEAAQRWRRVEEEPPPMGKALGIAWKEEDQLCVAAAWLDGDYWWIGDVKAPFKPLLWCPLPAAPPAAPSAVPAQEGA